MAPASSRFSPVSESSVTAAVRPTPDEPRPCCVYVYKGVQMLGVSTYVQFYKQQYSYEMFPIMYDRLDGNKYHTLEYVFIKHVS